MTSPDEPDQAVQRSLGPHEVTEAAHEPPVEARHAATESSSLRPRKSGWLWVVLSVIAFGGLSATLMAVLIGIGTDQTKLSGPSVGPGPGTTTSAGIAANNGPKRSTSVKGKFISAAKLAEGGGALSLPPSKHRPAVNWQVGVGGKDLAAVSRWFGDALQAGGIRQYSAMRYACVQLAGSAATAEAGPKIPDLAMQMLYARALAELAKGAADCRTAIILEPSRDETVRTRVDTALLKLSVSELAVGARDIFRATAEIEIASGQHL